MLFTCSVDKTGAIWDVEAGERIKKLKGHTSFVNSCCPTRRGVALLATGSDDGNIKVSWGLRKWEGKKKQKKNCYFYNNDLFISVHQGLGCQKERSREHVE
jgi:WD40 repeat protein